MSAMFAALVCIATMMIRIPSPLKGYLNLGDGIVLLAGWMLPPFYGFLAAGAGSAFADLFSGYTIYAPATCIIKGTMAVISYYSFQLLCSKTHLARLLSGILAELVMLLGYFSYESILYGVVLALANVPLNAIQGIAGLLLSTQLIKVFQKINILH